MRAAFQPLYLETNSLFKKKEFYRYGRTVSFVPSRISSLKNTDGFQKGAHMNGLC